MRTIENLTDCKFLNLKKVIDPENNVRGYFFSERLGKDSIAFVCYDINTQQILLNQEYKPPIDEFVLGAFGGSIDKDQTLFEIVKAEVKEEAGFVVELEDIKYLGDAFVSTQMNQFCHLFIVFVDKENQGEREPENAIEAMAKTKWVDKKDIKEMRDWKAITIMAKYRGK
jgi:8-oxo-dGTP pyrophosphatase MutT (NUDIX family)